MFNENENGKVKFCPVKKCKIVTKEGENIVKREGIIPQNLKSQVEKYIEHLEQRGIIRKSQSQ